MIITRQQIKQAFKELLNANIEMTLIDYLLSNKKLIITTRLVNLNSMSLNFMLNDFHFFMKQEKSINHFMIEQNYFVNNSADDNHLENVMNITFNLNSYSKKKIILNISSNMMSIERAIKEQEEESFMNISSIFNDDDDDTIDQKNEAKTDEFLKVSQIRFKKFTLKNLIEKSRKSLKKQVIKKLQSSRDNQEIKIKVNNKNYHVEYVIKYLHSCAKFFIHDSQLNLHISKSSTNH